MYWYRHMNDVIQTKSGSVVTLNDSYWSFWDTEILESWWIFHSLIVECFLVLLHNRFSTHLSFLKTHVIFHILWSFQLKRVLKGPVRGCVLVLSHSTKGTVSFCPPSRTSLRTNYLETTCSGYRFEYTACYRTASRTLSSPDPSPIFQHTFPPFPFHPTLRSTRTSQSHHSSPPYQLELYSFRKRRQLLRLYDTRSWSTKNGYMVLYNFQGTWNGKELGEKRFKIPPISVDRRDTPSTWNTLIDDFHISEGTLSEGTSASFLPRWHLTRSNLPSQLLLCSWIWVRTTARSFPW